MRGQNRRKFIHCYLVQFRMDAFGDVKCLYISEEGPYYNKILKDNTHVSRCPEEFFSDEQHAEAGTGLITSSARIIFPYKKNQAPYHTEIGGHQNLDIRKQRIQN